ncbi:Spc7 kinetochore protein-domain-containing protein [Gorgonomyces haynaldii]|nr:Spc7 kinetochore protein-domain-containing protein [Gorgonomyces haynaldii]
MDSNTPIKRQKIIQPLSEDEKENKKRRVSFASQAHVRLFDKTWPGESPEQVYDPAQEYFPVQNVSLEMPDLTSRRTSVYNLALSPVQVQEEEMDSFDVSITGSDTEKSPNLQRYSPQTNRPRDSISHFFLGEKLEELSKSPIRQKPESPPKFESPIIRGSPRQSITSVDGYFMSPKPQVSSKLRYSVTADEMESPEHKPTRDSVAHFFASPAKRRISMMTDLAEESMDISIAESENLMEASMDLGEEQKPDDDTVGRFFFQPDVQSTPKSILKKTPKKTPLKATALRDKTPLRVSTPAKDTPVKQTIVKTPEKEPVQSAKKMPSKQTPAKAVNTPVRESPRKSSRQTPAKQTPAKPSAKETPAKTSAKETPTKQTPAKTPAKETKQTPKKMSVQKNSPRKTPSKPVSAPGSPLTRSRSKQMDQTVSAPVSPFKSEKKHRQSLARGVLDLQKDLDIAPAAEQTEKEDTIVESSLPDAFKLEDSVVETIPETILEDSLSHVKQPASDLEAETESKNVTENILDDSIVMNDLDLSLIAEEPVPESPIQQAVLESPVEEAMLDTPVKQETEITERKPFFSKAMTDSPLQESQKDMIQDSLEAQDLMDEHLSIVEDSFLQEDKKLLIESLDDFLSATGTTFEVLEPVAVDQEPPVKQVVCTHVDYVKAAVLYNAELEIYEWGCKELTGYIEDSAMELGARKQEISQDPPLLFMEFAEGTQQERDEMTQQLHLTKQFCYENALGQYYQWRAQLLEPHVQVLLDHVSKMEGDEHVLDQFMVRHQSLLSNLKEFEQELEQNIQDTIEKTKTREQVFTAECERLDAEQVQQLQEIQELEQLLKTELEKEEIIKQEIQILEDQQTQLITQIEQSEALCKDLVVFDPEDLAQLRQEYGILTMTHSLRPVSLAPETWLYDGAVQIASDKISLSLQEKSSLVLGRKTSCLEMIQDIGIDQVQDILKRIVITDPSLGLKQVQLVWENLKQLHRDYKQCNRLCPTVIENDLSIKMMFFNRTKRARWHLKVQLDLSHGFLYPNGPWTHQIQIEYGQPGLLSEIVDESGPVKLLDWCQQMATLE